MCIKVYNEMLVTNREFGQKKHELCTNCQKKLWYIGWPKKHYTFVDFFSLLRNLGLTDQINTPLPELTNILDGIKRR